MKFILDVTKNRETRNTVYRNSPAYVAMFIVVGIAVLAAILETPIMTLSIGLTFKWVLLINLMFATFICTLIAHHMIFRGNQKLYELNNNSTDNIMKYYRVSDTTDKNFQSPIYKIDFTLMEHYNNYPFFVFQLKLGSMKYKASNNREFIEILIKYFGSNKLKFHRYTCMERFNESKVWDYWIQKLNETDCNKFKAHMAKVIRYLQETFSRIKVPTTYYKVTLTKVNQKFEIKNIIDDIYRIYRNNPNNYREMEFLDYNKIMYFFKNYHRLEHLDVGLAQALDLSKLNVGTTEVIWVKDFNGQFVFKKEVDEYKNKYIVHSNVNTKASTESDDLDDFIIKM